MDDDSAFARAVRGEVSTMSAAVFAEFPSTALPRTFDFTAATEHFDRANREVIIKGFMTFPEQVRAAFQLGWDYGYGLKQPQGTRWSYGLGERLGPMPQWPGPFDDGDFVPKWARTWAGWERAMRHIATSGAEEAHQAVHGEQVDEGDADSLGSVHYLLQPMPQPYGVSHAGAEKLVAAWMRSLGAEDVQVTQQSSDGGVDVVASGWLAQVKNYAPNRSVGVTEVRQLAGVVAVDGRRGAFFTSGFYASGAAAFAASAGIALFIYDAERALLSGVGPLGELIADSGFGAAAPAQ